MTQFKVKTGIFDELAEGASSEEVKEAAGKIGAIEAEKTAKYAAFQTAKKIFEIYKSQFNDAGTGLFDYPVLMAADILLYDTQSVPVGQDQVQHVELTRTLARRFNQKFGDTFIVPEYFVKEEGKMIMGLDDPTKKMSKSAASEYNYIALTDDIEKAKKKIMKAVTDSGTEISYTDEKPAIKNLINIYSLLDGKSTKEIVAMYAGKGYGDFKKDLAEVVATFLTDFQQKYNAITDEEALKILHAGAEKVRPLAKKKLDEVKKKVGFVQ